MSAWHVDVTPVHMVDVGGKPLSRSAQSRAHTVIAPGPAQRLATMPRAMRWTRGSRHEWPRTNSGWYALSLLPLSVVDVFAEVVADGVEDHDHQRNNSARSRCR